MKMKSKFLLTSVVASALLATSALTPAMAQETNTPNIDRAQQELNGRIQQGLASGQISPSEGQNFYRGVRQIEQRESSFKSDGYASPQERQALRQDIENLRANVEQAMARPLPIQQQATATPGIDRREMVLRDMIDDGVRNGSLSREEGRMFHNRRFQIERHEARFKADGVVTQQERRQLRNEIAALQEDIQEEMSNGRRTYRR